MDRIEDKVGEIMQLLWHSLANLSFGYLMLIALLRIVQGTEALRLFPAAVLEIGPGWREEHSCAP
jgi:hypothetical protein